MMDCRKRCGCRNKEFVESEALSPRLGKDITMRAAASWEKLEQADGTELKEPKGPVGELIAQLKKGLAAIAAAKSSQQFGREEEEQ